MEKAYAVLLTDLSTNRVSVLAVYADMNEAYNKSDDVRGDTEMYPNDEYEVSVEETLYCR